MEVLDIFVPFFQLQMLSQILLSWVDDLQRYISQSIALLRNLSVGRIVYIRLKHSNEFIIRQNDRSIVDNRSQKIVKSQLNQWNFTTF